MPNLCKTNSVSAKLKNIYITDTYLTIENILHLPES